MAPKARSSISSSSLPTNSFRSSKPSLSSSTSAKKSLTKSSSTNSTSSSTSKNNNNNTTLSPTLSKIKLSPNYKKLLKDSIKLMGKPTHSSISEDELEIILRVFDCSDTFGPVSNISRLDRYERSVKMGLEVNSLVSHFFPLSFVSK